MAMKEMLTATASPVDRDPLASAGVAAHRAVDVHDFDAIYRRWFAEVCRWARAFGAPMGDLDDVTQEVFLVVRRQLSRFDGGNLPGWLYAITRRTVSAHRRRAWFRHLLSPGRPEAGPQLDDFADEAASPEESLATVEARRLVAQLVAQLSPKRRAAFVLFEIEGLSGEEIAQLEGVPASAIFVRLHHARKDFARLAERYRTDGNNPSVSPQSTRKAPR
jgi:RNA polymerase sigma-70 factor (ECF subfamily)